MDSNELEKLYQGWTDKLAHPNSPCGGGGAGGFGQCSPFGIGADSKIFSLLPHPNSPAGEQLIPRETCIIHQLKKTFLIAKAEDTNIVTKKNVKVKDDILNGEILKLGQDITFSLNRKAPKDYSVGEDEETLKKKMLLLLDDFASDDKSGMTKKLFDMFLAKKSSIEIFENDALNKTIEQNKNFISFSNRALAASGTDGLNKIRIHQALKNANWDINKVKLIDDLGVPAFNRNEDWSNGLKVMINGVQYVFIYAEKYIYNSEKKQYIITLKFVLYDVFGLDDDDLLEYGASSDSIFSSNAAKGITAWWQLQHQFNYAPLLTKAVIKKDFTVSSKDK